MRQTLIALLASLMLALPFLTLAGPRPADARGSRPKSTGNSCKLAGLPGACPGVHGSIPGHGRPDPGSGRTNSGGSGGSGGSSGLPPNYATYCPQMIQTGPLVNPQQLCPTRKVSTAGLAIQASSRLPIPAPAIRTAPPRGKRELVGIPHVVLAGQEPMGDAQRDGVRGRGLFHRDGDGVRAGARPRRRERARDLPGAVGAVPRGRPLVVHAGVHALGQVHGHRDRALGGGLAWFGRQRRHAAHHEPDHALSGTGRPGAQRARRQPLTTCQHLRGL